MTTKEKYTLIKKKLNLKDADIAAMFGFKDANTFRNSGGYERQIKGIVSFYEKIIGHLSLSED